MIFSFEMLRKKDVGLIDGQSFPCQSEQNTKTGISRSEND
jgi:hypothetical protein